MPLRLKYFIWFIGAIALGLLSRSGLVALPPFIEAYSGDTIWAGMVYFLISVLFSRKFIQWKATFAILFSFAIEFSQLIQAAWFDAIRDLPGMRLVFGYGFKFTDLICYVVGIVIAMLLDRIFIKRR